MSRRLGPTRVYLYGACYHRLCLIWGHWISQVFALMCLEWLCCGEVIWYLLCRLVMSDDTGDGDWFPMAMAARSRTGGFRCCGWLYCVTRGAGLVAPPIGRRGCIVVLNRRGVVMYIRIVYTQQESIEVLQVTRSLLILFIDCCCIVLCLRSYCESLRIVPTCVFD